MRRGTDRTADDGGGVASPQVVYEPPPTTTGAPHRVKPA